MTIILPSFSGALRSPGGLILDNYSAAIACSVRRLRTAYTGPLLRVRRSTDNSEQDISFLGNNLNEASLLAFCGAGDGFVTTWYDQSGNGRNAVMTTAANQPQIVVAGEISRVNSRPGMFVDGLLRRLTTTHSLQGYTQVYVSFVGTRIGNRSPGVSSFYCGTGLVGSSGTRFSLISGTEATRNDSRVAVGGITQTALGLPVGTANVFAARVDVSGNARAWAGTQASSSAAVVLAPQAGDVFHAIGNGQTNRSLWGYGAETLLFNFALTDVQHAALISNQISYFDISIV